MTSHGGEGVRVTTLSLSVLLLVVVVSLTLKLDSIFSWSVIDVLLLIFGGMFGCPMIRVWCL